MDGPFAVLLIIAPGVLVGLIVLGAFFRWLRSAFAVAYISGFLLILALCAATLYGAREYAFDQIERCEIQEAEAHANNDPVLLDCESEGLLVAVVMLPCIAALAVFLVGGLIVAVLPKARQSEIDLGDSRSGP